MSLAVKYNDVAFASDLGFPVGSWPKYVNFAGAEFTFLRCEIDREGELEYVVYRDSDTGRTLKVFND